MKKIILLLTVMVLSAGYLLAQVALTNSGPHRNRTPRVHQVAPDAGCQGPVSRTGLKSALDVKYRLDSLIEYDYFVSANQWILSWKTEYAFDTDGHMTQYTDYWWDDDNQEWIGNYMEELTYDASGMISTFASYDWDTDLGSWAGRIWLDYVFSANGLIAEQIRSERDEDLNDWVPDFKWVYSYTADDLPLLTLYLYWDEGLLQWEPSGNSEYTYNPGGTLALILSSYWNSGQGIYVPASKSEMAYDMQGQMIQYVYSYFDEGTNQWVNILKEEYSYDVYGNKIQMMSYYWMTGDTTWSNDGLNDYVYDINGNPVQETRSNWDSQNGQFTFYDRDQLAYELAFGLDDLIIPPLEYFYAWMYESIGNMPVGHCFFAWNPDTQVWDTSFRGDYYYTPVNVTGLFHDADEFYSLTPNPVSNELTVRFPGEAAEAVFCLYDLHGRLVMNRILNGTSVVSLQDCVPGMFYYTLITAEKRISGKLIRQ